jgi:cellulase
MFPTRQTLAVRQGRPSPAPPNPATSTSWLNDPSPQNCAAADSATKQTAVWVSVCGPKPSVNVPTVNAPKATPTVNTPTVNTPAVNAPAASPPTVNTPTVKGPTVKGPTVNVPTTNPQ